MRVALGRLLLRADFTSETNPGRAVMRGHIMSTFLLSRLQLVLLFPLIGCLVISQAHAADCSSDCLSAYHVSITDLGTSLRGTVKVADEFFNAGAARGAVVQGVWTRQDGSTFLQSKRIGTRLRADFSFAHGGVPGTYTFEVLDVIKTGYSFDSASSVELSASITIQGSYNQAPTAIINADPVQGEAPLDVSFDALSSYDPDGVIAAYSWNLGDGGVSGEPTPIHTYTESGIYTVTLNVLDDNGARSSSSVTIQVLEAQSSSQAGCQSQCLSVDACKMSVKKGKVVGKVRVKDENGETMHDVSVIAFWTLPDGTEVSQTKLNGSRNLTTFRMPATQTGIYTLSVHSVTKDGYRYYPDGNKSDSGAIRVE